MDYALEERIGHPDLFTGRKEELVYFLKWINDIKERKSQSTAMLARRKMGKTAIMERLFNITFFKNNGVIPFYYEIKENNIWVGDFCDYSRVWKYDSSPEYSKSFSVDIFARALSPGDYSIIGEVKSRELKKFSKDEVVHFLEKCEAIKKMENLERVIGFIFSRKGFTKEAEAYCKERGIACSEDERWLEL